MTESKLNPLTTSKIQFLKTDEGIFALLFLAVIGTYLWVSPHFATIIAVYDAVFAYSGMQKYRDSSGNEELENEIEESMGQAMELMENLDLDEEETEDA